MPAAERTRIRLCHGDVQALSILDGSIDIVVSDCTFRLVQLRVPGETDLLGMVAPPVRLLAQVPDSRSRETSIRSGLAAAVEGIQMEVRHWARRATE